MNRHIDQLLNLCFEIEGLITLVGRREENTPQNIVNLLQEKAKYLCDGIDSLQISACKSDVDDSNDKSGIDIANSAQFEELEDAGEGTPIIEAQDIQGIQETTTPADPTNQTVSATSQSESVSTETSADTIPQRIADRPAELSINDKFRFRRELFGNSDAELADALQVVNAMNSVAEIEDYFYNDLCWDPQNEDVKDFIRIVSANIVHK